MEARRSNEIGYSTLNSTAIFQFSPAEANSTTICGTMLSTDWDRQLQDVIGTLVSVSVGT